MRITEINKKFTAIVNAYINAGWWVNTTTMGGSQSNEIARVHLSNGEKLVAILLEREYRCFEHFAEGVKIVVGEYANERNRDFENGSSFIIWNNELNIVSEYRYVNVVERGNGNPWFLPEAEYNKVADELWDKRLNRCRYSDYRTDRKMSDAYSKVVKNKVNSMCGFKSAKAKDIEVNKRRYTHNGAYIRNEYLVYARGKYVCTLR